MHRRRQLLAAVAVVTVLVAACSDDDDIADTASSLVDDANDAAGSLADQARDAAGDVATDAAETAVRNVAARAGANEFDKAGAPIDGELTCETDATGGADAIKVTCSGSTTSGGAAEMTGTTSEAPGASVTEIKGEFVGTVDGSETFRVDHLGS
jgi:hypothetical protein